MPFRTARRDTGGPKPGARSPEGGAYLAALKLLAGRELAEAQVRHRLGRKGYSTDEVETAVLRLKAERAIDDARVAAAIAHRETSGKKRGKLRVRQALARAGIDRTIAGRAVDTVFADTDADLLIDAALARRLRGRQAINDDAEFRRLYRYLVAQGFDTDHVLRTLRARRRPG